MPKTPLNLAGRTFDRLTVIKRADRPRHWVCRCACGNEKTVHASNLLDGKSRSCGCLQKERASETSSTHGMTKHAIYHSWSSMLNRCTNPKNEDFKHYGGRGIEVCDRWRYFEQFRNDMLPSWAPGLTLEREDTNGNYEPGNCRWATQAEQLRNTRRTVMLDTPWGRMCQKDAAAKAGISVGALVHRLAANWPEDQLWRPSERVRPRARSLARRSI